MKFLIKYQNPRIEGLTYDTVEEHKVVLEKNGYVDLGKIGKVWTSPRKVDTELSYI